MAQQPVRVADHARDYRDLFAVVDNDWLDLPWFKNLAIPDATSDRAYGRP